MQPAHMFTESLREGPISQKQLLVRIRKTTSMSHDTGPSTGLEIEGEFELEAPVVPRLSHTTRHKFPIRATLSCLPTREPNPQNWHV
jgi:hypothetical protein